MASSIFTSITEKKMGLEYELERIAYIWYPVTSKNQTQVLLDSQNKINTRSQAYAL